MNIFSKTPELLGDSQTIIGVFITLIVLCLFSNESNFLLKLICNMVADFTKNLQEKISEIRDEIKSQKSKNDKQLGDIVMNRKYWVKQAKQKDKSLYERIIQNNKEEQDILSGILNNLNEPLTNFDHTNEYLKLKRENVFVSLFFLILLLSVMVMDACCISNEVGSIFLSLLTFITSYFTIMLWYRFSVDQKEGTEYSNHSHILRDVVGGTVSTIFIWILLLGGFRFNNTTVWFFSFFFFVIMVAGFSYHLMHNFRYCVRYNNQFVIKHSFYIMFVCALITLILYGLCNVDCSDGDCLLYSSIQNIQFNIGNLISDSNWTKRSFVFLAALNTFFIPLLVGYYYNHKKAVNATKQMEKNKKEIMNLLKDNISEYQEILKDIQGR